MRLAACYIFLFFLINFQVKSQPSINALIAAEKDFASSSITRGTKAAFLENTDSNSIVFVHEQPQHAREVWEKRNKQPFILNWRPEYAEISLDGKLGYTTGPYTIQKGSVNDSILGTGSYFTIWNKKENGEWKFLIDDGIRTDTKIIDPQIHKINVRKISDNKNEAASLFKEEQNFIDSYHKNKVEAYRKYKSVKSILYRDSHLVSTNSDDQDLLITIMPDDLTYTILGSGRSSSADFQYIYGTVSYKETAYHYIRVWRREEKGWKIAVEILHYPSN